MAKSVRLDALQVLRAIAAAMVVFVHGLETYYDKVSADVRVSLDIELGSLGVELFFVISGFIICCSARNLPAGPASAGLFIRRRLIRIVPIYWIATLIYAAKLGLQGQAPTFAQVVQSLFFVPYLNEAGMMRPILGVGWSLNYEMLFYLVFAGALFLKVRARYLVLAASLGFLVMCRAAGWLHESDQFIVNAIYLLSGTYLLYFMAGTGIALLQTELLARTKVRLSLPVALFFVSCVLIGYALALHAGWIDRPEKLQWELPLCILCVALCITPPHDNSGGATPSRVRRMMTLAGDGSYSTYLTHGFVMGPLARLVSLLGFPIDPLTFALVMVVVCTAVGVLVFQWVESPLMRNLNSEWGRPTIGGAKISLQPSSKSD